MDWKIIAPRRWHIAHLRRPWLARSSRELAVSCVILFRFLTPPQENAVSRRARERSGRKRGRQQRRPESREDVESESIDVITLAHEERQDCGLGATVARKIASSVKLSILKARARLAMRRRKQSLCGLLDAPVTPRRQRRNFFYRGSLERKTSPFQLTFSSLRSPFGSKASGRSVSWPFSISIPSSA